MEKNTTGIAVQARENARQRSGPHGGEFGEQHRPDQGDGVLDEPAAVLTAAAPVGSRVVADLGRGGPEPVHVMSFGPTVGTRYVSAGDRSMWEVIVAGQLPSVVLAGPDTIQARENFAAAFVQGRIRYCGPQTGQPMFPDPNADDGPAEPETALFDVARFPSDIHVDGCGRRDKLWAWGERPVGGDLGTALRWQRAAQDGHLPVCPCVINGCASP